MSYLPSLPSLPLESQKVLKDLADYYRTLVEYHEQALASAREQLHHAEALLNANSVALPEHASKFLLPGDGESNGKVHLSPPLQSLPGDSSDSGEELESQTSMQSHEEEETNLKEAIAQILATNRGTLLHVNYIVRELFGELTPDAHASKTALVESTLSKGENHSLWDTVPDSPGCYTFSLEDFPDLVSIDKPIKRPVKQKPRHSSRVPHTGKLEYMTLNEAVGSVLKENYPNVMRSTEVLEILYPQGLSSKKRVRARQAISNTLSKGSGIKGWKRISPGRYVWTTPVNSERLDKG